MSSYKETSISLSYATLIQQSSTYGLKTVIKNQYVHGTPIYKTFKNLYNNILSDFTPHDISIVGLLLKIFGNKKM